MPRSLFRLVRTDPPSRHDFLSHLERGLFPPQASARQVHLYQGISMFETEEQARRLASETGRLDEYIAEVVVPDDVDVERQGQRPGHTNVYAGADDLLSWVVRVVPVG